MNILFYYHLTNDFPEQFSCFKADYPEENFIEVKSAEEYEKFLPDADIVVTGRITEDQIEKAVNLKVIFIPFTGVNTLPFDKLLANNITVCNNHGNGSMVAERAVALALAVTGRIAEFDRDLRKGNWHIHRKRTPVFDYWTSIQNKPVSILGTGVIGRNIARMMSGFNCRIIGFRRNNVEPVPEYFDEITDSLDEALVKGEIVFITLPLTDKTENIISERELNMMKGKYIINVSRGEIVNEQDLYSALSKGVLKGAAIDSWYQYTSTDQPEILPSKLDFHKLDNLILSPHAASHTIEGKAGQFEGAMDALGMYLSKNEFLNRVNLKEGY